MATPLSTIRRRSSAAETYRQDVAKFFSSCLSAYEVFSALGDLTEDLRVLSFNAEFASGRAGAKGNTVRVLTQATRELVNNLSRIFEDIEQLESRTYTHAATATTSFRRLDFLNQALHRREERRPHEEEMQRNAADAVERLKTSIRTLVEDLSKEVGAMIRCTDELATDAGHIAAITQECDAIAVSIAVEAATAGAFREEFEQVSETMHRYVQQLQQMVGGVTRAVRSARERGDRLGKRLSEMK